MVPHRQLVHHAVSLTSLWGKRPDIGLVPYSFQDTILIADLFRQSPYRQLDPVETVFGPPCSSWDMYGALLTREIFLCVGGGRCLGHLAGKRETSGFKSYNRGMKDETDGHLDSTMEE